MSRRHRVSKGSLPRNDVSVEQVLGVLERARTAPLSEADYATLRAAVDTLAFLTQELAAKGTSIDRLRKLLFGASTEKTRDVVKPQRASEGGGSTSTGDAATNDEQPNEEKPKPPGHGRRGADEYTGAERVHVPHESLHRGDGCPECARGKVYPLAAPAALLRIEGMAPLAATRYECDRLRCNLCGEVFTAKAPDGVGDQKYDESASTMVGMFRYGAGVPFNRIEKLEANLGVPLPASTQWDLVEEAAVKIEPAHHELIRQAAQAELIHNDDTTMTILGLSKRVAESAPPEADAAPDASGVKEAPAARPENKSDSAAATQADKARGGKERKGTFTTGIVARAKGRDIALFFTGTNHAGENLEKVLRERAAELPPPIQMCDALSRNVPATFKTILSNCIAHGRRSFVDVFDAFPKECTFVLEELAKVFARDAEVRARGLSPAERLREHQQYSQPIMEGLHAWMVAQIEERKVEPNSGLGEAIAYMRRHWTELTLFLRVAGAPLDNNICERALKKAILHRKNSYFFKTLNGALVGDRFMSLIHTCELNRVNPFNYLVALQTHYKAVAARPNDWLPWNYTEALARIAPPPTPPS